MSENERTDGDTQVRRHGDGHLYLDVTRWEHLGFVDGAEVDVSLTLTPRTLIMASRQPEDHGMLIRRVLGGL